MDEKKELNLETFSEIMDEMLTKNHIQMLLEMPEGTQNVTYKDNVGAGPVVVFYILLKALPQMYKQFRELLDDKMQESFIDSTLALLKDEIMEVAYADRSDS